MKKLFKLANAIFLLYLWTPQAKTFLLELNYEFIIFFYGLI